MQNNFKDITKSKYFPIIPYLNSKKNQNFLNIALTLCVLSFFGLFAIKPTISTIFNLQKEISDNQFVLDQMETKIENLTGLRKQYFNLQNDLPIIAGAITIQPDVQLLFAQIQSIARTSGITIRKLQNSEVEILKNSADKKYRSYSFSISGSGSFESISKFMATLTNMERVVDIDTFSVNSTTGQGSILPEFDIQGTAFFKDNL